MLLFVDLAIVFLGNFLRNTSSKVSSSITGYAWVVYFFFVFFFLPFLFSNGNLVDLDVNILSHY